MIAMLIDSQGFSKTMNIIERLPYIDIPLNERKPVFRPNEGEININGTRPEYKFRRFDFTGMIGKVFVYEEIEK